MLTLTHFLGMVWGHSGLLNLVQPAQLSYNFSKYASRLSVPVKLTELLSTWSPTVLEVSQSLC